MILYSSIGELLKKPLSVDKNGDIVGISQQAIKNYSQLKKNTDFANLENFLNGLYYGKEAVINGKQIASEVQEKFAKLQSNTMSEILGNAAAGEDVKVQKKHTIGQQGSVSKGTYTIYLNMLQELLDNWGEGGKKEIELRNLKNKIITNYDTLREKINNMIKNLTEVSAEKIYPKTRKGKDSKYAQLFKQIQELENLGVYLTELQYVQGKIGDAQERLLKLAEEVGNGFIEEVSDGFTEEEIKNLLSGKLKEVTTSGLDRVYDIKLTSNVMGGEDYKRVNKSGQVTGYNFDGVKVSIGAIRGFQQKMDVEFDIPNYQELRVSMKSWNGFSGHDLGTTSLLNALLRTANVDSTFAFGLQLKFKDERKYNTMELHKWAKTVAVMDIAAGLGQKKGYADTLIIQDRKNQRFRIFNMRTVMEQALSDGGYFQLTGYDTNMVSHMNFTTRRRLSGQQWRGAIAGALQAQQISIGTRSSNL